MHKKRIAGLLVGISCAAGLGLFASLGAHSAMPDSAHDLEGTFVATIHESAPIDRTLKALFTFTRDGGIVETNFTPSLTSPFGPVAIAHGAWARTGDHQFALTYVFLGQTPGDKNSSYVRGKVRAQIMLNDALDAYSGVDEITQFDAQGNVIVTATGAFEATRIVAEPIDN